MKPPEPASPPSSRRLWWLMAVVLLLVACARLRLLNFPLERDEGEYAYAGQLILQGIPPYVLAYNMKFPGTYVAYAIIMGLFGQSIWAIHLGILLMTTGTALMLFWLGRKLLDDLAGVVAASSFVLLSACTSMLGQAGHATHFCAFFCTAGLCLMWLARQRETWPRLAAGGFLFGTAVLMKQHAVLVAAWAGLFFAFEKFFLAQDRFSRRVSAVAIYGFSMLAPLGLCCLWLWLAGVFANFKFWTFDYARQYAGHLPWKTAWTFFYSNFTWAITGGSLLWLLALAGLVCLWLDVRLKHSRGWLLGFTVASALAVLPDFYFRLHYFLILVPAVAVLNGVAASHLSRWWATLRITDPAKPAALPFWGYVLMVIITVVTNAGVWFYLPTPALARALYGNDPLPESIVIANYIREHSSPTAKIAVLGSEPEIYFLSHRHSATGYLYYTYARHEVPAYAPMMKQKMIAEIESRRPEFIVVDDRDKPSAPGPDADLSLFNWWDHYQTNYTRIGVANIVSPTKTIYAFGTNQVAQIDKIYRCAFEVFELNRAP